MPTILDEIVAHKQREVAAAKQRLPIAELERVAAHAPPVRPLDEAVLRARGVSLIAEVKRASPSRGLIRPDFQPVEIAEAYQRGGAAAVSVLTDEKYFQGSLENLQSIRLAIDLPILRKDFIIDPYQIFEARAAGADAVLLIAECLSDTVLGELYQLIRELGMSALIELYEPDNLSRVMSVGPTVVGVNSRNLRTFEVDFERMLSLRKRVPREVAFVAESGIARPADVRRLAAADVDAMLVGEALMASDDVEAAARMLREAGEPPPADNSQHLA